MLKNTSINRIATKRVALALGELNERAIYVGGAVVSLYIDDNSAEDVRPTKDVDISLEIVGLGELEQLRGELNERGFYQSSEDNVICRFRFEDIKVDVMSTIPVGWAPANPWFKEGFNKAFEIDLDGVRIKILPLVYYLATKFEAYNNRGGNDPRASHDYEDIVYLLNHTSYLKEEVLRSDKKVRDYLKDWFSQILTNGIMQEAIIGHLFYEGQMTRYERIIELLSEIYEESGHRF